ncbi:MAG TPA: hypothetical protein VI413_14950 [Paludibacter sp.]
MKFVLRWSVVLISFLFFGCSTNDEVELKKYSMVYIVRNNGDATLLSIAADSYTYFPIEKVTEWIGAGKNNYESTYDYDREHYLYSCDSIILKTENKVYNGCYGGLKVHLIFDKAPNYVIRDYFIANDTIRNSLDCTVRFSWPDDSVKYRYTEIVYAKLK